MRSNLRTGLAVAAAGVLGVGFTAGGPQGERYQITGEHVAIYNLVGTMTLEGGSGDVTVDVVRHGGDAAQLRIERGEVRDRETLRVVYPADRVSVPGLSGSTELRVRDDGTFGDGGGDAGRRVRIGSGGGGLAASADLRVRIPAGRIVEVYLAAGEVTVSNVDGELHLDTHSAPVRTSGTRGSLEIDVGSGRVEVADAEGDVSIDTGSGSVSATGVRGDALEIDTGSGSVTASDLGVSDLSIDTGSGSVSVSASSADEISIDTGSGGVTLALTSNPTNVSIDTGSGSVTVTVPASFGAEVDLETSSGGIGSDFPVTTNRIERDHLQGVIGSGAGRLTVETGSGSIRIVRGS
jgi:lia operon protein LiaG